MDQELRVLLCVCTEIVHEDVKIGSDGESDQVSATSSDEVHSPVRVRLRNNSVRKISTEVHTLSHTQTHALTLSLITLVTHEVFYSNF